MKRVTSGRVAPQVLDEREAMDNPPGTPRHLLSEVLISTQGVLDNIEPILTSLDQPTVIPSTEARSRFHFSQLIDQLEAIRHHDALTPVKDELNIFPTIENYYPIHREANAYHQNQQSLEQFTDLKAYSSVVSSEIRQCFDATVRDIMCLVNMLCNYSRTLFVFLIPELEDFYDCKNDAVEMTKIKARIELMCEKSIEIAVRYQLSEFMDKNDRYGQLKEHATGSILLQVEAVLAELYQRKQRLTRLKVVHPEGISVGITELHALLYNAGLYHDEFLSQVIAIKQYVRGLSNKSNELNKSGFSYACDKVIADYLGTHPEKIDVVDRKVTTVIKQERRRSRSEDFPSKPTPALLTSQSTSKETWEGRFLTRNNRVNSMGDVRQSPSPEPPAVPTDPKTGVVSLTRGSSFGQLLWGLPKDKTTPIPTASRQSTDKKRRSGANSMETPLLIQKPCLEAITEDGIESPDQSSSSLRASHGEIM